VAMRTKGKREEFENAADPVDVQLSRHQMRMYSFKQLFNIFTSINNKSEVHDRVCKAEEDIKKIFDEIDFLKAEDQSIRKHTDKEIQDIRAKFSIYKEEQA